MIGYHAVYDLADAGLTTIDPFVGSWRLLASSVLIAFLLVSGASDALSASRSPAGRQRWRRAGRRAVNLGVAATAVTIVTALAVPELYVRFGVLHCLAVAALLLPLVDRLHPATLTLLGVACIALAQVLPEWADTNWLMPLGVPPADFRTMDYVPLLPWLGVILLGRSLGAVLPTRTLGPAPTWLQPLLIVGRHALLIYLLHQPILWLILGLAR